MTELTLDIPQIRIITDALIALKPEAASAETEERLPVEEMDPLINRLLSQAEAQIGARTFTVKLAPEDAHAVKDALLTYLEVAAEGGDIFLAAEIDGLLGQMESV
ncbi:hypothetical protein D3C87_505140 [compost metagenome]